MNAERHLKRGLITPFLLPYHQIAVLCSANADFVRTETGELVPLTRKRRLIAFIGCEACDLKGNILIPSQLMGKPSETAKFVELFSQPNLASDMSSIETLMVVVTESYKIYDELTNEDSYTYAPVKTSWLLDFLFLLFGIDRILPLMQIELVKLRPSDLKAIIDEYGIHLLNKENYIDLQPSLDQWKEDKVAKAFLEDQIDSQRLLKDSVAVIFDLSIILEGIDHQDYIALASVLSIYGSSINPHDYEEECSGLSDEEGLRNLLRKKNLSSSVSLSQALEEKQKIYSKQLSTGMQSAFPKAIELVKQLTSDGKKCFLVTSTSKQVTEKFIFDYQLASIFAAENRYLEISSTKREAIYPTIVGKSGNDAKKCVLIDKSHSNLTVAKKFQIRTIGISMDKAQSEFQADTVVEDVATLYNKYVMMTSS
jgi:beta-phosphoglucomutase-like phosphatase (HAD superfamily)